MTKLPPTRAARVAQAHELRSRGLKLREIAQRMGVAVSTAGGYLTDPDGSQLRARKRSYAIPCPQCGGPTSGSNGPHRPTVLCASCREWTEPEVIAAMQRFAAEHGRPPGVKDWQGAGRGGYPPSSCAVIERIGWNELLRRAGLNIARHSPRERYPLIAARLRDGATARTIATELGITVGNVYGQIRTGRLR